MCLVDPGDHQEDEDNRQSQIQRCRDRLESMRNNSLVDIIPAKILKNDMDEEYEQSSWLDVCMSPREVSSFLCVHVSMLLSYYRLSS